ncbi:hypothetical protein HK104_001337 [Borealophlyctis nickersoniae]|nr:hypothetical protein HK104_001337 [Borealophlyctis nickersoniae]
MTLQKAQLDGWQWQEVPADGIYIIDLEKPVEVQKSPFGRLNRYLPTELDLAAVSESPEHGAPKPDDIPGMPEALLELEERLAHSVQRRIETIPAHSDPKESRLGILFSGGLDCMCLAALADRFLPPREPCDLLNVAFENPRIQRCQDSPTNDNTQIADESVANVSPKVKPKKYKNKNKARNTGNPARATYDVPDRITGRLGAAELTERFPGREWRFVEIDVPYAEAVEARSRVMELIRPLDTVMDLSIAIAFWFAARGVGHLTFESGQKQPYSTSAKVLFSGLGADEQMAGYGRHRVRYNQGGWEGLLDEVQMDVDRISSRNLGRDDRIVSDHGREVRFPFLDEAVVQTLASLPIHIKTDPRRPKGVGEKMLLRQLALHKLTLIRASGEPKRAVQFGARTARMENGRQKGEEKLGYN